MKNKTKTFVIIIIIIFLLQILCGCFREESYTWHYYGADSEVLLSPISDEEFDDSIKRSTLIKKLETNFSNVTVENEEIYVLYNEKIYVAYNDFNFNKACRYQCSVITFNSNNSIMILSSLKRKFEFWSDRYEYEKTARDKTKNLFKEDKDFLSKKNSMIIDIIQSIYVTEIIYETYIQVVEE
jgi:hypothetical protein